MLVQQSESLREKVHENLNMRIKAWVMQCPERIAWVRGIVGEAAIRNWRRNRLADYALNKYFGDWKRKWPNGFKNDGFEKIERQERQTRTFSFKLTIRDYAWKPFALVKTINVIRFLYGRRAPKIDRATKPKWTQPREQRARKPIRFTPNELEAYSTTEHEENNKQDTVGHLREEHTLLTDQRGHSSSNDPPFETKPP